VSQPPFDLGQLLQQAQELRAKLERTQADLRLRTASATVGGGMVEAVANGQLELVSIRIDPQAVDPRDVEMLQDLIVAAVNQALERARELAQEEMRRATGLPIGDLLDPFGGSHR
jgi:DNA-binding YbaB/EbfC family protein